MICGALACQQSRLLANISQLLIMAWVDQAFPHYLILIEHTIKNYWNFQAHLRPYMPKVHPNLYDLLLITAIALHLAYHLQVVLQIEPQRHLSEMHIVQFRISNIRYHPEPAQ